MKTSVDGGLLDTSIGVSSCRLEVWSEISVCSEGIDLIGVSNKQVLTMDIPSVFTVSTFELSAGGKSGEKDC